MQKTKTIALRIVELALFLVALGFLIPPVPSHSGPVFGDLPAMIIGGSLFAGSLGFAVWRGGEHWIAAVVKLLAYLLLVHFIYARVFQY